MASNTGWSSPGEELMTCNTSAVAVCCSSDSRSSVNSRAFSIAITAWSAKVRTSSICRSVNGSTRFRARLCEAAFGLLIIWDGAQFQRVAFRGVPDELIEAMRQPLKPMPGGFADRLVRGERVIAVPDLLGA